MRLILIAIIILFTLPARACIMPGGLRTVFFDSPPQFYDGKPFAAKVMVVQVEAQITGVMRVQEVLMGDAPGKEFRFRSSNVSSCGPFIHRGDEGLVAGEFQHGVLILVDQTMRFAIKRASDTK